MSRTETKPLPPVLNSKVAGYSLGAVVGAMSVASSNAAVIYVNAGNRILADTIPNNNGVSQFYPIDLNADGVADFSLRTRIEANPNIPNIAAVASAGGGTTMGVIGAFAGNYPYAARLSAGNIIDGSAAFLTVPQPSGNVASMAFGPGYSNSQWAVAGANSGYLGIRFTIAGDLHFAWVRVTVALQTAAQPRAFTLHEWAYESTPGVGITAGDGAIPEPTSLGLLALGSIGLAAHRRRRTAGAV